MRFALRRVDSQRRYGPRRVGVLPGKPLSNRVRLILYECEIQNESMAHFLYNVNVNYNSRFQDFRASDSMILFYLVNLYVDRLADKTIIARFHYLPDLWICS